MTNAVETMMGMAKATPNPQAVSNWLTAFLGKRPLDMKRELLNTFETEVTSKYTAATDQRAATLVVKVIQKVRETLR
jgi:hypothetical protein